MATPCTHQWHRDSTRDTVRILRYRCALCQKWGQKNFGKADSTIRLVTAYVRHSWDGIDAANIDAFEKREAALREG
mgnify:CR=1 FL=1